MNIRIIGDVHGLIWDYIEIIKGVDKSIQLGDMGFKNQYTFMQKLMLEKEKHEIARDTIYAESNIENRKVYLITAKGPGGTVGQPGNALKNIINKGTKPSMLIMIDAALRLEGEKTGEIAEGIGAAIGGIGVDRFKIEEIATENNIPIYAIVIKQTLVEAISIMRKEIAETTEPVHNILNRLIRERTKEGNSVIIIGVGNTAGVGQ